MTLPSRKSPTKSRSSANDLARVFELAYEDHLGKAWPSARWASDPIGFAETVLGVKLWPKQEEFLLAIRDNKRVAISGGRKIGKDFFVAVAALWWYASFDDARVFLTATNNRQVEGIAYREIRKIFSRSGRCIHCKRSDVEKINRGERPGPRPCPHSAILTGEPGELARTGIVSPDFREIKGATSKDPEGMAGLSGARILAIVDEASGYPEPQYHAIRGNLAAEGCREILISNPTRANGFFFDAFHKPASMELYKSFQVSSMDSPNYVEGREIYPGLASRSWVEEQKHEWGEDSPLFKIHVKGEFVLNEDGAVFSVALIADAIARWADTTAEGPLTIGVDAAGESGLKDESAFAARRGKKILHLHTRRGLSPEAHVMEVLGIIIENKLGGDHGIPLVVIDSDGDVGSKVAGAFTAYLAGHENAFELKKFRGSDRAIRQPLTYDRIRDELYIAFRDWFRNDGSIPEDAKLSKELNAFRFYEHVSGRTKVMSKDDLRKVLGRSPDRVDACALACWETRKDLEEVHAAPRPSPTGRTKQNLAEHTFDPYRAEAIDPYESFASNGGFDD